MRRLADNKHAVWYPAHGKYVHKPAAFVLNMPAGLVDDLITMRRLAEYMPKQKLAQP